MECNEVNGFHFPEIVYLRDEDLKDEDSEKGEFLSPNDLMLLSKEKVKGIFFFLLSFFFVLSFFIPHHTEI